MRYRFSALALFSCGFWLGPLRAELFSLPTVSGLSPAGRVLVYEFEVGGGRAYYDRFLVRISWPGGHSGPTGGIGYDFAYNSSAAIRRDWRGLSPAEVSRLATAPGCTGSAGRLKARELSDILIAWRLAEEVFDEVTVARFWQLCQRTWPGFDELRPNVQSALWSLTYNRGNSMAGPGRAEMREIARLTARKDYAGIAAQIRAMKRLWRGQGLDGLLARREAEARLVETP